MVISTDNNATCAQNLLTFFDNRRNIEGVLQMACKYLQVDSFTSAGTVFMCVFFILLTMAKPVFTTKSSTIHRVDYDEKENVMEIEFRTGNVYRYYNVPPRMWKIFQLYVECEGSAGSFFNEYIKNQFTSEKMGGSGE
jgi:hypothetical protein